jgi:hypothetical protein
MLSTETSWEVVGANPDTMTIMVLKASFSGPREVYLSLDGHHVSLSPSNCMDLRNELNRIISE